MGFGLPTVLGAPVCQDPHEGYALFIEEGDYPVAEQVCCGDGRLLRVQLGHGHPAVGIYEGLLVDPAHSLDGAIYRYLDVTNEDPKPFVWTKTADQILASVARFCQRTLDTGH